MKLFRLVLWVGLSGSLAVAQEALTNDSIIKLVKAGLSEDLVISMIRAQPAKYSLGMEQVLALKEKGVPEKVLAAMIDRSSATPASTTALIGPGMGIPIGGRPTGATPAAGTEAAGDPNNPMTPHDSGIYIFAKDRSGDSVMTILEQAAYQGSKTGGMFVSGLTYGIKKAKMKAVIPGSRSTIRTSDPQPIFYFYFEDKAAGLGKSPLLGGGASNPNQFALIRLEEKDKNRETIIGEFGAFGASTGTHEKSMVAFKSDRLRAGLYKVVPTVSMKPGEYCFMASSAVMGAHGAGAAGAVQIFDFAINSDR